MSKIEKRIFEMVDNHLPFLVGLLCTLFAIVVRISLRDITSGDYIYCLSPWYEEISVNGLSTQVGNYNFAYQFIIWILTKLDMQPLYAYKIISCFFDWALAITTGIIVQRISKSEDRWSGIITYSVVLLSPLVFLNSSVWAQCDAIYCTFAVLALVFLEREYFAVAFCFLGISFAFKLQAILIPRTLPLCAGLIVISLNTYGAYLFNLMHR